MNLTVIESWLAAQTGLVGDKLGPGQVARVARERLRVTGCENAEAYVALLTNSRAEQLCFIEAIVVAETWFFRDRGALDGLARHIVGTWAARHSPAVFRGLSVPCSTGEEPYSMAMALALAGWPAARLQIDAVDISRENLRRGAEGVFRKNSFRGSDLGFRDVFFDAVPPDAWRVREGVRAPVRFQEANLLADDFASNRPLYDAIFCRNLLIYFDPPEQTRAFRMLARLLTDDGLLAVGPAEAVLALQHGFSSVPGESMFLFQKARPKKSAPRPPAAPARMPRRAPRTVPLAEKSVTAAARPRCAEPSRPAKSPLQTLRAFADSGQLREATQLGESLLREAGPSAELCYLLAVVADAAGDAGRAEGFYRKALYLDPRHAEALAHLALLLEKNGDTRAAAGLRARARRMSAKETVA